MNNIKSNIGEFHAIILQAKNEWLNRNANSEASIKKLVFDVLDKQKESVIAGSLGFNRRFGDNWEVDHCNGRDRDSFVGNVLREYGHDKAKEWLASHLAKLDDFKLPEETIGSMMSEASKQYRLTLKESIKQQMKTLADRHAQKIITNLNVGVNTIWSNAMLQFLTPDVQSVNLLISMLSRYHDNLDIENYNQISLEITEDAIKKWLFTEINKDDDVLYFVEKIMNMLNKINNKIKALHEVDKIMKTDPESLLKAQLLECVNNNEEHD